MKSFTKAALQSGLDQRRDGGGRIKQRLISDCWSPRRRGGTRACGKKVSFDATPKLLTHHIAAKSDAASPLSGSPGRPGGRITGLCRDMPVRVPRQTARRLVLPFSNSVRDMTRINGNG
ncbi:jg10401 [Pararge aegeria aegeria]|uniref:Jg10401 protein n=1 Tax=Pararge aegeria aegeria TaxID=348720 RepID=A0A8S4RMR3_9NEOP|nr:jg10401 [Pararge aegeria aegeria]